MPPGPNVSRSWLWLIVLLAAALRFFPVWFGLPYVHARPDEGVSVGHAMEVLDGKFNPQFFHWPSLTFYVFAAVFGLVRLTRRLLFMDPAFSPDTAVVLGRACVALAGTATVVVLCNIGRRVADWTTGLLAAAFLSVAILHVRDSHFAMTDVLMTFFLMSSLAMLLRAFDEARATPDSPRLRPFLLAGLLGGLATSTKYNAGVILAAMGAAQLLLLFSRRGRAWSLAVWLPSVAFAGAFAFGFIAATPFAILDFATFSADLRYDFTHLSQGHGIYLGRGWTYHLTRSLPYGCGLTIFLAALAGIPLTLRAHRPHAWVLAAFSLAFYVGIGSGHTVFFRYVVPLVPVVCLLAAIAVRHGAVWLARRAALHERAALLLLVVLVGGPALVHAVWFDVLLARTDTRVLAGAWLGERIRPGDTVHDAGGDYARLELGRTRFHYWNFDPATRSFGHPEGLTPHWLVLTQSPLRTYANAPASLRQLANDRYDLVFTVRGTTGAAGAAVYDLQDAFFLPLSGFHTVERPGPTINVYRRRD